VTSRVRLDEKYYDRRAVQKLAKPQQKFARIFGVFFAKEMPGSSPALRKYRWLKKPTQRSTRKPKIKPRAAKRNRSLETALENLESTALNAAYPQFHY
jgi:hypothetical protein